MKIKKTINSILLTGITFLFCNFFVPKEKDALNKRVFETTLTEVKEGQNNIKGKPDEIEFKDGKVFSNVLNEKLSYKWLKYTITVDSAYVDEKQNEITYYEAAVNITDDKDQSVDILFKIKNTEITGEVKISKKEKLKKKFIVAGKEKEKK